MKQHQPIPFNVCMIVLSLLVGFLLTMFTLNGLAFAQEAVAEVPSIETALMGTEVVVNQPFSIMDVITSPNHAHYIPPLTYVRIISHQNLQVYAPVTNSLTFQLTPTRRLKPGFLFSSITETEPLSYAGTLWYQINPNEYLDSQFIKPVTPTNFSGVALTRTPEKPFGWVIRPTPIVANPGGQVNDNTHYKQRYDMVTIYETQYYGEWGWHRIGENQWIALYDVGAVRPINRPTTVPTGERWVEIDLFEQSLAAYNEYDEMVFATLISSGLQGTGWETPTGTFRIKRKVKQAKMSGGGRVDWYFLEDVTASMYFTGSVAMHAAYWHDDFGRYKSHGCVNMTPNDASWMFSWSTPIASLTENKTKATTDNLGTWVWVHEGQIYQQNDTN